MIEPIVKNVKRIGRFSEVCAFSHEIVPGENDFQFQWECNYPHYNDSVKWEIRVARKNDEEGVIDEKPVIKYNNVRLLAKPFKIKLSKLGLGIGDEVRCWVSVPKCDNPSQELSVRTEALFF